MSLDLVLGKAVPLQETVGLRPDSERVPTPDEVQESSMPEGDLERMLQALRRRSRRLAVTGGTPGPGKVVTQQNLLTGE